MSEVKLYNGDCLNVMKSIPDGSIDMVLCDLPYGTTQNKWDFIIPFEPLWEQYNRVAKQNAAFVLFAQGLFYVDLVNSNRANFRYFFHRIFHCETEGSGRYERLLQSPLLTKKNHNAMKTGFWIFFTYIFGCILAFALAFRKAMDGRDDLKIVYAALIVGLCCAPLSWLFVVSQIVQKLKKKRK